MFHNVTIYDMHRNNIHIFLNHQILLYIFNEVILKRHSKNVSIHKVMGYRTGYENIIANFHLYHTVQGFPEDFRKTCI